MKNFRLSNERAQLIELIAADCGMTPERALAQAVDEYVDAGIREMTASKRGSNAASPTLLRVRDTAKKPAREKTSDH